MDRPSTYIIHLYFDFVFESQVFFNSFMRIGTIVISVYLSKCNDEEGTNGKIRHVWRISSTFVCLRRIVAVFFGRAQGCEKAVQQKNIEKT